MNIRVTGCIYAKLEQTFLVVIQHKKNGELYFVFPGGKKEKYDVSISEALRRELQEELQFEGFVDSQLQLLTENPMIAVNTRNEKISIIPYLIKVDRQSLIFDNVRVFQTHENIIDYAWIKLNDGVDDVVYYKGTEVKPIGPVVSEIFKLAKNMVLHTDS